MPIDVTDASFEADILSRSEQVAVVVDLWAPWCGPCRQLGPILEKVIDETGGKVVLTKINVDENPQASAMFRVQGIPAVYALRDRKVVNGFVGAQGEAAVRTFVESLLPTDQETLLESLLAAGDEASLRQALELEPANDTVICALAELLVNEGRGQECLALLDKIPETPTTRRIAALARVGDTPVDDGIEAKLDGLLGQVKADEAARQEFLDLLEVMGPEDPRTPKYRKALTSRLF